VSSEHFLTVSQLIDMTGITAKWAGVAGATSVLSWGRLGVAESCEVRDWEASCPLLTNGRSRHRAERADAGAGFP
jgi:hypothetical protein